MRMLLSLEGLSYKEREDNLVLFFLDQWRLSDDLTEVHGIIMGTGG